MSGYMPKMRQIRVVFVIYGHYISLIIEPKLTLFPLRVTFRSIGLQTPSLLAPVPQQNSWYIMRLVSDTTNDISEYIL